MIGRNIRLVFAVATCNKTGLPVFGNKGELPWPCIKEDLKYFKRNTMGTCLLMGANTFRSLPNKLKGRAHAVISSSTNLFTGRGPQLSAKNGELPDFVFRSLDDALLKLHGDISVIGGVNLIKEASKYANELIITSIPLECEGDVIFEDLDSLLDQFSYVEQVSITSVKSNEKIVLNTEVRKNEKE